MPNDEDDDRDGAESSPVGLDPLLRACILVIAANPARRRDFRRLGRHLEQLDARDAADDAQPNELVARQNQLAAASANFAVVDSYSSGETTYGATVALLRDLDGRKL